MATLRKFTSLFDLLTYFSDEKVCRNYLEQIRWEGALKCPYKDCQHDHIFRYADGKRYKCAKCERQYSVKVGTIFEDSKICLQKWFTAIYLITSHKKGISSHQLHRDLRVTQKTAWFMLHRVRYALSLNASEVKLGGVCEADETFIGGAEANKHKHKRTENTQGRSTKTKTPVVGILQRNGELRAEKVADTRGYNLRPFIIKNLMFSSELMTDEWYGYRGLRALFKHSYVKHSEGQYVDGSIHTNGLEGFWSLLKRGIAGIYHSVSAKHLQPYLNEFVFRYNSRKFTEDSRFDLMLTNISSRLTYKTLIAHGNNGNNNQMETQQASFGF